MVDLATLSGRARALGAALEPFVGSVYFAPEVHARYVELGFQDSAREFNGVAQPDAVAYFTSRGSLMGQVPGEVVAAAFAVFNPAVVVPAVTHGWTRTDAATIVGARRDATVAALVRVLGPSPDGVGRVRELLARAVVPLRPEGRPLFAGALSQPVPADDLAAAWHYGDMLREYRGDSHTAAWISIGLDATEIGLMTELYWGMPMRSYSRTRAWSTEDFDAATERLVDRGLVADGALTDIGRQIRETIELSTDMQMREAIEVIGDDFDELVGLLGPWGAALRAAHCYPAQGPHDLVPRPEDRG